ncbi:hypothetical protein D1871_07645 [Nakamurella silvestris]|nr:hypothetical protein D1871_07645 [Nakamurella silvestris]
MVADRVTEPPPEGQNGQIQARSVSRREVAQMAKKKKAPRDWGAILTGIAAVLGAITLLIQTLRGW